MEEELLFQGMDDMDYTNLLTDIPDDVQDSTTIDDEVAHAIDDYEDELEFIKEMEELVAELSESNSDFSELMQVCSIGGSEFTNVKFFKIVGDNIDKNFRQSYQRINHQTRSFHYFHSYALLERIDLCGLSDLPSSGIIILPSILSNKDDVESLKHSFRIFISS